MKIQFLLVLVLIVAVLISNSECRKNKRKKHKNKNQMQRDMESEIFGFDFAKPSFWDGLTKRHLRRRFQFALGPPHNKWFNMGLGWSFGRGGDRQLWWTGPNVCKSRTVTETNLTDVQDNTISRHFSYQSHICDQTESAYKCTTTSRIGNKEKKVIEVFECCHGYTRKEIEYGCPRELKLLNLVDTAQKLGLTEFLRATNSVDMTEELREGNFTVFAPVNSAWKDEATISPILPALMPQDVPYMRTYKNNVVMVSQPISDLVVSDMRHLLLGHLVVGTLKTSSMQDEQLIETGSPYKAHIRVNFYNQPQKLVTANCLPLISTDNEATNGVIHTVDGILQPVTLSLMDIVSKNPELSFFKTVLGRSSLAQLLRKEGQLTVFAPSDKAFQKLSARFRDRLLSGDTECLGKILKNHILSNVICSQIIQGKAKSPNLLDRYLNLTRDKNDKLFVEGSQVTAKDIMATNGVFYIIDDVLVPDEALDIIDLAKKNGYSKVLGLLKQSSRIHDIENDNITFFAPTNKAIEDLPEKTKQMLENNQEEMRKLLSYHIVKPAVTCSRLYNNYQLDTLLPDKKIRINEYSSFPFSQYRVQTAQCVPIKRRSLESCNGIINVIDAMMFPPMGNVIDILSNDKRFSRMVALLKKAGLADTLQENGPFTVFAPTDKAFEDVDSKEMEKLENNTDKLRSMLNNHIVQGFLCCAGIFESNWFGNPKVKSMSGETFSLDRYRNGIRVGHAEVNKCDNTATNGLVHEISRVLLPRKRRKPDIFSFLDYWDF